MPRASHGSARTGRPTTPLATARGIAPGKRSHAGHGSTIYESMLNPSVMRHVGVGGRTHK
jgi:hypothetical protein